MRGHVLLDRGPQVTFGIGGELDRDPRVLLLEHRLGQRDHLPGDQRIDPPRTRHRARMATAGAPAAGAAARTGSQRHQRGHRAHGPERAEPERGRTHESTSTDGEDLLAGGTGETSKCRRDPAYARLSGFRSYEP